MTITPATERALAVMRSNRYFALSTVDAIGPWTAALAYVLGPPNKLYFYSQAASRHGKAIALGSKISGLIYDSTLPSDKVESIQFSGSAGVVTDVAVIGQVLRAAAARDGGAPPTDAEIEEKAKNQDALLFFVTMDDAYVLDQELFARSGIDGRQHFSPIDLFSRLL